MPSVRERLLEAQQMATRVLDSLDIRQQLSSTRQTKVDPDQVAYNAQITVMRRSMGKLLGAYINETRPGILINHQRPRGLVNYTFAHELGHHFLGHGTHGDEFMPYNDEQELVEREANQFAIGLLAPKWLINQNLSRLGISSPDELADPSAVYQLSLRLGLSFAATRFALAQYNFLSHSQARRVTGIEPKAIKAKLLGDDFTFDYHNDVWLLNSEDSKTVIQAGPGDVFVFKQPSKSAAGYAWTLGEACANGFEIDVVSPATSDTSDVAMTTGGPDIVLPAIWNVSEMPNGSEFLSGELVLEERRPWLPASGPINAVRFELQMSEGREGLTPQSRRAMVEGVATIQ